MRVQRCVRVRTCVRSIETLSFFAVVSCLGFSQETHYSRFRDPKWYARQVRTLQDEVAKIDVELRTLAEARKSGRGATDAVALDEEPEGVNPEGQITVLRKRRFEFLNQIDALEEQARHNAIPPGDIRKDYEPEPPAPIKQSAEMRAVEESLAQAKENLEHARKEIDLLRRNQKLKAQQENSNPEPRSRRDKPSDLAGIGMRLTEKEAKAREAEQRVAELEDQLEDLRRIPPIESEMEADSGDKQSVNPNGEPSDKDEAYWRKQFAAIGYKITTAQTELDILQRELNSGLVQYDPNPATAMKESITRRKINEHRKAIEDKKKELAELKKQRDELEDALRHAGGPAGWGRE
jgi:hypothetical protein